VLPASRIAMLASQAGRAPVAKVFAGLVLCKASLAVLGAGLALYPRLGVRGARHRPLALAWAPQGHEPLGMVLVVGLIALIGLALRLPHLGDGLWLDEILTLVDYVRMPLAGIVTTFDNQNQHLLYSASA